VLIGIDGCVGGWVVAESDGELTVVRVRLAPALDEVLARAAEGDALVVVDMPIGLPASGPRRCDLEARRWIGRRFASSVFPAPVRAVLDAPHEYHRACEASARVSGRRLSRQVFHLLPKIRALDAGLSPAVQTRVREGHPELTFRLLHGAPLVDSKHTAEGLLLRRRLLAQAGAAVDPQAIRQDIGRRQVGVDDVLDAVACLLTAHRLRAGTALELPLHETEVDERGLRMTIAG